MICACVGKILKELLVFKFNLNVAYYIKNPRAQYLNRNSKLGMISGMIFNKRIISDGMTPPPFW